MKLIRKVAMVAILGSFCGVSSAASAQTLSPKLGEAPAASSETSETPRPAIKRSVKTAPSQIVITKPAHGNVYGRKVYVQNSNHNISKTLTDTGSDAFIRNSVIKQTGTTTKTKMPVYFGAKQ